jgi:photosystem II stability/assembly factor-like uncharacterized protein
MNRFTIFFLLVIFLNTHSSPQSNYKYSDIFFLDDHNGWILSTNGYLGKTTNAGTDWMRIYDSRIDTSGKITFVDEQNGWMLLNTTLYSSANGGNRWTFKYEFPQFSGSYDIAFINDSVGFVANAYNLYKTTNSGNEWTPLVDTLGSISNISWYNENLVFISSSNGLEYLYKSTDGGITWSISNEFGSLDPSRFGKVQMFNQNDGLLSFSYSTFIGVSVLLKTTDAGNSWNSFGNGFVFPFGLSDFEFLSEQNGWVATNNRNIFRTTDSGASWDTLQTSLTLNEVIYNVEFFNPNISYGTNLNHIYQTIDGWVTYLIVDSAFTGINEQKDIPMEYYLEQNYPNPFNPTTTINYSIPKAGNVVMKVYDILGNEIKVLVNEEKPTGKYSFSFTPNSTMLSGIYFYQLISGNFSKTKKMLFIK